MIKNKELTYKDVPMGYPLCFNHECAKTACCMYYQARLTLPEGRHHGPYYRVHHGENMLTPEEQEEIMKILAQYGSTEGVRFDHYVEGLDFGYYTYK